jgi:hypothetical protein
MQSGSQRSCQLSRISLGPDVKTLYTLKIIFACLSCMGLCKLQQDSPVADFFSLPTPEISLLREDCGAMGIKSAPIRGYHWADDFLFV